MIKTKARKWGGSFGLLISKRDAEELGLKEDQEVVVEITKKTNVLKELFGFAKGKIKKPTEHILKEARKNTSKYF